ncbi:MAG: PAS domain-containing protein, partial [Ramlibacter sp.]
MQGRLSLRERVVMLTLAAVVPLSALSVWLAVRETRSATGLVQSQLKFAASLVAANQDRALESAEHLLTAISAMPELRSTDRSRCQAYFESLRGRYPAYSNLGVIELDGTVACNANGVPATVNLADRPYFRDVLARRRFVVGEEVESRASGRRSIPFAMPVVEAGQVTGVAFAALDLEAATASLARTELPEGASVLVADRRGRVLMEHPSREALPAPGVLLNGVLLEAARSMSSGVGEAPDAQGRPRLLGYAASQPEGTEGLLAIVSIDRELVDGVGLSGLREQLGVAALMLLLGVAGAWWVGGRVILRPYKQILGAVRRLEQGRADVRIPLQARNPRGEFARIASAFNRMAESLQLRRIDLEAELGRSQSDYAVLEQVLNSMQEGLIAVAGDGQFLMFNEAAARLFPLHEAPVAPREWPQQWGLYHLDGQTLYRADDLPLTRAARGESGQQQPLFVRNPLVPDGRLLHCSFRPMRGEGGASGGLVVFTDVTQLQRLQAEQVSQFAELRETQRRLMEAQRIGRVGNWDLDVASGHMWWSDEVYELFGLAREHFGATLDAFSSCVHPADRAKVAEARNAALENGGPLNLEYRIIRPDGSLAWMHDIAETRRGADGMAVWFGGVVQDISDSKNAEDELVQFTSMLKRTAEAAQAITADQTIEGTMQAVVDKARAVIGAHQAVLSLTTDNDWSQVVTALSVDERFSAYRGMTIMPDGSGIYAVVCESNRPLRLTQAELEAHPRWRNFGSHKKEHPPLRGLLAVPLVDPVGHNIGLIMLSDKEGGEFNERDEYVAVEMAQLASIAIDNARLFKEIRELNAGLEARIDERTAELTRQEQQYRTLAEQAPEVVWNADTSGEHLTFLNHAWYELVGGTPQDWIGRSGTSAIHPDDRKEVSANWRRSR